MVLGGLLQKNAVSGAILGSCAEDTCSSSYGCRRCTREISKSPSDLRCLPCMGYACAHVPEISRSCQEPCAGGATKVMTTTPKDITGIVPGLENAVLGTVPQII